MKQKILNVLLLIQVLVICGCTNKELIYHGYSFNDVKNLEIHLENFHKTQASKQSVLQFLGSPTFVEATPPNGSEFFYVENIFKREPFIGDKKIETKVLRIKFNDSNKMQQFKLYTTNQTNIFDGSVETTVQGNEMKFLEQIKKNLHTMGK